MLIREAEIKKILQREPIFEGHGFIDLEEEFPPTLTGIREKLERDA